jgi:hypothetical protein
VFVPVIREKSFEGHSSRLNFSKSMASNLSEDDSSEESTVTKKMLDLYNYLRGTLKCNNVTFKPKLFLKKCLPPKDFTTLHVFIVPFFNRRIDISKFVIRVQELGKKII